MSPTGNIIPSFESRVHLISRLSILTHSFTLRHISLAYIPYQGTMPSVVSTAGSSRMAHHAVSQADLDVLALLTSDESSLGPLPTRVTKPQRQQQQQPQPQKSKRLAQRESPMDALLISAVLSGSDPLTRHHFGHGAGRCLFCEYTRSGPSDNL